MKRILLVTLLVVLVAPAAWAQTSILPSLQFGLGGGMNMPLGSIGDGVNNGYNINASIGFKVIPTLALGVELGYFGSNGNDQTIALLGTGGDFSMSSLQLTAMGRYMVPVATHDLYGKGLLGGYRTAADISSQSLGDVSVAEWNLGGAIGAGFQLNTMKSTSLYGEAMYHRISGDTQDGEFATFNIGILHSFN